MQGIQNHVASVIVAELERLLIKNGSIRKKYENKN